MEVLCGMVDNAGHELWDTDWNWGSCVFCGNDDMPWCFRQKSTLNIFELMLYVQDVKKSRVYDSKCRVQECMNVRYFKGGESRLWVELWRSLLVRSSFCSFVAK